MDPLDTLEAVIARRSLDRYWVHHPMQLYYKQQKMMVDDGDMSKSNMSKSNQASPALRRKKKLIGF
jgi:hypothetical protein